jgi:hypothetical protein
MINKIKAHPNETTSIEVQLLSAVLNPTKLSASVATAEEKAPISIFQIIPKPLPAGVRLAISPAKAPNTIAKMVEYISIDNLYY